MILKYRTKDGEHRIIDAVYLEIEDAPVEEIHNGIRVLKSETYSVEVTE